MSDSRALRHAPGAMTWEASAPRWLRQAWCGLLLLWAAATAGWLHAFGPQAWSQDLLFATILVVLSGGMLLPCRKGLSTPQGTLCWTGAQWQWQVDATFSQHPALSLHRVIVARDLGQALWLQLQPHHGRPFWIWLCAGASRAEWMALRRALHWSASGGDASPLSLPAPGASS